MSRCAGRSERRNAPGLLSPTPASIAAPANSTGIAPSAAKSASVKPARIRFSKAAAKPAALKARQIDVGQDEAREGEEEVDPEVTIRHQSKLTHFKPQMVLKWYKSTRTPQ